MQNIHIDNISTGVLGGSSVVVAHLDHTPVNPWADQFAHSTSSGVFGQYPQLNGDRVIVVNTRGEAHRAIMSARHAVTLANALLADHEAQPAW